MEVQKRLYPNALRSLIEYAGYSFREVSRETGIPERTLYDWAAGKRVIPHKDRQTLAHLLRCSADDLAPGISPYCLIQCQERIDEYQQGSDAMDKIRRYLLQTLGTVGATLFLPQDLLRIELWERLVSSTTRPSSMDESTLRHFEMLIDICWRQSNGDGFAAIEQLLLTFLPHLATFAQYPTRQQRMAARLASQGYQLIYVATSHREDFTAALTACKQAYFYGKLAHDANLQATSLIRQGVTFLNRKRPYQTLESYQQALILVNDVSPLVRARLYAGLAEVHGKLQHKQDALTSIALAHKNFPDISQHDPATVYIHFPYSALFLHEGLALLDLQQPAQATQVFEHVDGLHPKMEISARSRVDLLNQQALAAGLQGNLEQFCSYLGEAISSAQKLGSDLRVSEAWDIFARMHKSWRYEPQMQTLRERFA